ncbi:MAG: 3TM-type holin [Burkholderiaceae bacterium]
MIPLPALFEIGSKVLDKVLPDPEAKAKAMAELEKVKQEGRLAELNADNIEAQELTKRQQADMASDSWLSKNIRPMTLVFILVTYTIFGLMSAWDLEVNNNYVELLGQWGMLIMSFYFGGRTLEKILAAKGKDK